MTLVADELFEDVVFPSKFRINRSMQIAHIRPWMLKWQFPSTGEVVVQVLQNDELLAESVRTMTEINAEISGTFFHGMIRFDFDALQLNHDSTELWTEYEIRVFTRDYVNDSQNFMAVNRRYELKIYDTYGEDVVGGEAPNDMVEPLGYELFEWDY